MSGPSWASGWYVRKRHVYEMQVARANASVPAICGQYTGVYPNGTTSWNGHEVPIADSPAVMALPACKLCLRRVGLTVPPSATPNSRPTP